MSRVKDILKYINSMPFSYTVKHYQALGPMTMALHDTLDQAGDWDALRQSHPNFSISENRDEWLRAAEGLDHKDGQDRGLLKRGKDVSDLISRMDMKKIISLGVGGGGLEYQIKKHIPSLTLICSEYSQVSVNVLKKVFLEADDSIFFDIKHSDWRTLPHDDPERTALLMYRIDVHTTDKEWRKIFERIHAAGIQNIIFIPSSTLTWISFIKSLVRRLSWAVRGTPTVCVGFQRTTTTFRAFWSDLYSTEERVFGGLRGFILKKI
jgi:hypothetical protein